MSPLIERFISLVLSGYGKQREKLGPRAREELMARLHSRSGVAGQEEALVEACERLERRPPVQSRWAAWRAVAFNLTPLLVFLAVSWWYLPDYYLDDPPSWLPASQVRRIEERRASLVISPLPKESRWKEYRNLPTLPQLPPDPNNPEDIQIAALPGAARVKFDWHQAWRQADPDNSWYLLQQANVLASKAIDEADTARRSLPRGSTRPPLNPATMNEMIALCEEAARLPHFIDYTQRPLLRQIACLRSPLTSSENSFKGYCLPQNQTGVLSYLRPVLLDQLKERDLKGDEAGVIHLAKVTRRLALLACQQTGASAEDWNSYLGFFGPEALKGNLIRRGPASALPFLEDVSDRYLKVYHESLTGFSNYDEGPWEKAFHEGMASHRYPAVPQAQDFRRPSRLLRYSEVDQRFAWFFSLTIAVGLLLAAGFHDIAKRVSPMAKAGSILRRLHRPGALFRTFLFGLILPAFAWVILMAATPFGLRDLDLSSHGVISTPDWMEGGLWLPLMISGSLLVLTATLFLARLESYKSFAFLGLRPPDILTGWASLAAAMVAPTLFGIARWMTDGEFQWKYESAAAGLLGLVATVVLFRIASPFLHFRSAALGSVLTFRLVRPVLWTLSIVAALSIPALKHYEARWISELPPGGWRVDTPQWLHDHTQSFRIAIREEFANEPPYTGE